MTDRRRIDGEEEGRLGRGRAWRGAKEARGETSANERHGARGGEAVEEARRQGADGWRRDAGGRRGAI